MTLFLKIWILIGDQMKSCQMPLTFVVCTYLLLFDRSDNPCTFSQLDHILCSSCIFFLLETTQTNSTNCWKPTTGRPHQQVQNVSPITVEKTTQKSDAFGKTIEFAPCDNDVCEGKMQLCIFHATT